MINNYIHCFNRIHVVVISCNIELPYKHYLKHQSRTKYTAKKMKFSIKGFLRKCDQIRNLLRIWSHLLKKSLMENFIFRAVIIKKEKNQEKLDKER